MYYLRFNSLIRWGYSLLFPCNSQGEVDVTVLSPKARQNWQALNRADFRAPYVEKISDCKG